MDAGKLGVTRVRGDQIKRLNIRVWIWRKEERVEENEKVKNRVWKRDEDGKSESQHASFALPYVSVSPRSLARVDHLIHYLHDLRCLESATRKHYKTVAC